MNPYDFATIAKYSTPLADDATFNGFSFRAIATITKLKNIDQMGNVTFGDTQHTVRMMFSEFERVGLSARATVVVGGISYIIQAVPDKTQSNEIILPVSLA